jgi:AraC-like DNA-binding protein
MSYLNKQGRAAPVQIVARVARALEHEGVSVDDLLSGSDLTPDLLQRGDTWVSFSTTKKIIEKALTLSDHKTLGIAAGRLQTPAGLGVMGYAAMCCTTLEQALILAVKYQRIVSNINWMSLEYTASECHWVNSHPWPMGSILPFAVEDGFTILTRVAQMLTGKSIPILEAWFSYEVGDREGEYRKQFGENLRFNAPTNRLCLDRDVLDYPILQSSPLGVEMATKLCDELMMSQPHQGEFILEVRHLLLRQPGYFPDETTMAQWLKIAPRTLRYRLKREGFSYLQLLNDARMQLGREYLRHSPLKIDDISSRLGYADARCFRRAFRHQTGLSPSDYRQGRE